MKKYAIRFQGNGIGETNVDYLINKHLVNHPTHKLESATLNVVQDENSKIGLITSLAIFSYPDDETIDLLDRSFYWY